MITVNNTDREMIANNIIPFESTHPGEILKEELLERDISQKRFAELINVPYTALNEILNGKRPMSVDFALRVEAALGIDADLFITMQTRYNTQIARRDNSLSVILQQIRKSVAVL